MSAHLSDGGLEGLRVGVKLALAPSCLFPDAPRQPLARGLREDHPSEAGVFLYPLRYPHFSRHVVWDDRLNIDDLRWIGRSRRERRGGGRGGESERQTTETERRALCRTPIMATSCLCIDAGTYVSNPKLVDLPTSTHDFGRDAANAAGFDRN